MILQKICDFKGFEVNVTDDGKFAADVDGAEIIEDSLDACKKKITKMTQCVVKPVLCYFDDNYYRDDEVPDFKAGKVTNIASGTFRGEFWITYEGNCRTKKHVREIYRAGTNIAQIHKVGERLKEAKKELIALKKSAQFTEEELRMALGLGEAKS